MVSKPVCAHSDGATLSEMIEDALVKQQCVKCFGLHKTFQPEKQAGCKHAEAGGTILSNQSCIKGHSQDGHMSWATVNPIYKTLNPNPNRAVLQSCATVW